MKINIDHLTEPELIELNQKIVQRLRMLHQMHAHVRMLDFKIGERVWFQTDRQTVEGVLVRYNKQSVTVITDDGQRWTVSPGFLRRSAPSASKSSKIIEMETLRRTSGE
jgi:hypothetical protein